MRPEVNKTRLTVLIALLFSALCAGVFRTPPILFMAALLVSAPVVGILVGTLSSRGLRLERRMAESGTVGEIVNGEIAIGNANRWPVFLVHTLCGGGSLANDSTENERDKNKNAKNKSPKNSLNVDASRQNFTNQKSVPAIVAAGEDELVVPLLRSRERMVWKQQWLLQKRGVHLLDGARAGALDPLGLYNRMPASSSAQQIVVLPRVVKIDHLGFLGGEGASSQMPRRSTSVADAMDFHGVRPWQPGEAIRRAHWKTTARTGLLHVVEWEETPTADLAIFLDTHAGPIVGDEIHNTLESAITTAASIAHHLLENGCRVQLFFYTQNAGDGKAGESEKPKLQKLQARSVDKAGAFLRALAEIEPVSSASGDLSQLMDEALPQMARGLGVLLLASERADLANVLSRAQAQSMGAHCHAMAFEFPDTPAPRAGSTPGGSTPGGSTPEAGSETAVAAAMPSAKASHHTAARSAARDKRIQVIRSDDALAAALERRW